MSIKVLVCGSRTFNDYKLLEETLNDISLRGDLTHRISCIIHGDARGADRMSGEYAKRSGIPLDVYPALWDKHGKAAGPIRNAQMLTEGKPDRVVAFLGPVAQQEFQYGLSDSKYSPGTKNMISQAEKAGVKVIVVDVPSYGTKGVRESNK